MKYSLSVLLLVCLALGSTRCGLATKQDQQPAEKIEWLTMEEGVKRAKTDGKKLLIDVYTDWCGWCKRMDATTYEDPEVVQFVRENYHAIRLDAEQHEDITINGTTYKWQQAGTRNGVHELAYQILNGEMSYPTTVFAYPRMDTLIAAVPGYLDAKQMNAYLHYFHEEAFKKGIRFEQYKVNTSPTKK